MGTLAKVKMYVQQALGSSQTNAKLDAIAQAIAELADFVDDLENQLKKIDKKISNH
jgi:hypothetical protein